MKLEKNAVMSVSEILKGAVGNLQKESGCLVDGVSTGYYNLDFMTKGFHNSDLIILTGDSESYRTMLALNLVRAAVMNEKSLGVYFSLAKQKDEISRRFLTVESGVFLPDHNFSDIEQDEQSRIEEYIRKLEGTMLYVDDTAVLSVKDMIESCRNIAEGKKLGFVVVDYLQLISSEEDVTESQRKKRIISSLKGMAKELNCPVIVLLEQGVNRICTGVDHPKISDIDDYDLIAPYADIIMILSGDRMHGTDYHNGRDIAVITLAKNRSGRTGSVKLRYDPITLKFSNL